MTSFLSVKSPNFNHENEIIISTISALKSDSELTKILSTYQGQPSIFTHIPQDLGETYPFVLIYGIESNQFDNDSTLGFEGTITVHTWDNTRDIGNINRIKRAIYNVLHNNSLEYYGYSSVEYCQEFTTTLRDTDGITMHGVQRFKFILQEG